MGMPSFVAKGTFASGTGALTPGIPSGIANNDILLLFVEGTNEGTRSAPTGWTEVSQSPRSVGSGAAANSVRLNVFWKRTTGTESAPSVADMGDHQTAIIMAFRGVKDSGNPWNVTAGGTATTSSLSCPAVTTTASDCLIVNAIATDKDLNDTALFTAGPTNASLADLTVQHQQTVNTAAGGGLIVITGELAAAGSSGNTTGTLDASEELAMLTIALQGAYAPLGTTLYDFTTGSLPTGVTASGGANGTRVNSSGDIVSASAPRFDYDPVTLASRGLLVEPASTNLFIRSAELETWTADGLTRTANATTAPDGAATAESLVPSTANEAHRISKNVSVSTSTRYTVSFYGKPNGYNNPVLYIVNHWNESGYNFNLSTEIITKRGAANDTVAPYLESAGSGFKRLAMAADSPASLPDTPHFYLDVRNTDASSDYAGNGTSGIYAWGAQLEAGSKPTSYIPTTTASVTRSADAITLDIPSGVSEIQFVFDNLSAQTVSVTGGTTYAVPTTLNEPRILRVEYAAPPITGEAVLSGSGSLTASGIRVKNGAAALSGAGALTASGQRIKGGSALLSGAGTLTASATRTRVGAALLSGSGTLAAAGSRTRLASALLSGTSSLTALGGLTYGSSASLSGTGTLAASGERVRNAAAALSGSGSLTAAGERIRGSSSSLGGVGSLTAAGERIRGAAAALGGVGSLTAAGERIRGAAALLSGSGSLTAAGDVVGPAGTVHLGSAGLSGSGTLAAMGFLTARGAASLVGVSALYAAGSVPGGPPANANRPGGFLASVGRMMGR